MSGINAFFIFILTYRQFLKTKVDIFVIERVKEKRIENGLSQSDLAYELGMSVGFIGKIEKPPDALLPNRQSVVPA